MYGSRRRKKDPGLGGRARASEEQAEEFLNGPLTTRCQSWVGASGGTGDKRGEERVGAGGRIDGMHS